MKRGENTMKKMTLEDAIIHAEEVANTAECEKCAQEHVQLAKWLKELKFWRDLHRVVNFPHLMDGGNKDGKMERR